MFFGTAPFACPSLVSLCRCPEVDLIAVVTQPDRPRGRSLKTSPPAVKELATRHELPVLQPERVRDQVFLEDLRDHGPDLIVVAAYGQILPQALLDLPTHGCLNVHSSLLPKFRGAAPIQWALLTDCVTTGVTIMKMDAGMDTGAIVAQESTAIHADDNAETLHDRLSLMGGDLLVRTVPEFVAGKIVPRKQAESEVSLARKLTKEDGDLNWTESARALWNRVRALNPWPGAYTWISLQGTRQRLKVLRAEPLPSETAQSGQVIRADQQELWVACGGGALRLLRVQREGGKPIDAGDFIRGSSIAVGDCLGVEPSHR